MTIGVIIVAGGIGTRMGADIPKQLLTLRGRPIITWTLDPFLRCSDLGEVVVVSEASIIDTLQELLARTVPDEIAWTVTAGGATRQESVRNGLAALGPDTDIVVVHDAVRPFVRKAEIEACASTADEHGAASLMRPVHETVKVVRDGIIVSTLDRSEIMLTQTPQAFRRELLTHAHEQACADGFPGTDDCMLVERLGTAVHTVSGSEYNIKITTPGDLRLAEALLPRFSDEERTC